jgi:hypothetical protein
MGLVASLSPAQSGNRIWLIEEPSKGTPSCEEFFDKWDIPGAPAGMLVMAGIGREVQAAQDCVAQNKIDLACKVERKTVLPVRSASAGRALPQSSLKTVRRNSAEQSLLRSGKRWD